MIYSSITVERFAHNNSLISVYQTKLVCKLVLSLTNIYHYYHKLIMNLALYYVLI